MAHLQTLTSQRDALITALETLASQSSSADLNRVLDALNSEADREEGTRRGDRCASAAIELAQVVCEVQR